MKRINVIGTTGSGKSTFAHALAAELNYPLVQMDQLYWKANWRGSPDDEFYIKLQRAISGDIWVLDGNYSRTCSIKWSRVDTIVWIDYSFFRTLWQLSSRTIRRSLQGQELWPDTGNKETFTKSFLSKDSILIWFFRTYGKNRRMYDRLFRTDAHNGIQFVRLRTPSQTREFLYKVKQACAECHMTKPE